MFVVEGWWRVERIRGWVGGGGASLNYFFSSFDLLWL